MGGLLAMALALRRPDEVPALALVAAPWDFHAVGPEEGRRAESSLALLEPALAAFGELPVDAIQWPLPSPHPPQVSNTFPRFHPPAPGSPHATPQTEERRVGREGA